MLFKQGFDYLEIILLIVNAKQKSDAESIINNVKTNLKQAISLIQKEEDNFFK